MPLVCSWWHHWCSYTSVVISGSGTASVQTGQGSPKATRPGPISNQVLLSPTPTSAVQSTASKPVKAALKPDLVEGMRSLAIPPYS